MGYAHVDHPADKGTALPIAVLTPILLPAGTGATSVQTKAIARKAGTADLWSLPGPHALPGDAACSGGGAKPGRAASGDSSLRRVFPVQRRPDAMPSRAAKASPSLVQAAAT